MTRAQPKVGRLPVHDARAGARHDRAERPPAGDRRHPGPDRGRQRRAPGLGHEFLAHIERDAAARARARARAGRRVGSGRRTTGRSRRELREHGAGPGRAAADRRAVEGGPGAARARRRASPTSGASGSATACSTWSSRRRRPGRASTSWAARSRAHVPEERLEDGPPRRRSPSTASTGRAPTRASRSRGSATGEWRVAGGGHRAPDRAPRRRERGGDALRRGPAARDRRHPGARGGRVRGGRRRRDRRGRLRARPGAPFR